MNIRTPLFHLSLWRDGWFYFCLLPEYKYAGFGSRNSPPGRCRVERVPGDGGRPTVWFVNERVV